MTAYREGEEHPAAVVLVGGEQTEEGEEEGQEHEASQRDELVEAPGEQRRQQPRGDSGTTRIYDHRAGRPTQRLPLLAASLLIVITLVHLLVLSTLQQVDINGWYDRHELGDEVERCRRPHEDFPLRVAHDPAKARHEGRAHATELLAR